MFRQQCPEGGSILGEERASSDCIRGKSAYLALPSPAAPASGSPRGSVNQNVSLEKRSALTLLEVVVGLVLMGSLLVSSLLAFSQHRKQLRLADKRIEATAIADGFVNVLLNQRNGIPTNSRGSIPGKPGWIWVTSPVGVTKMATIEMQVVRFEIFESGESPVRLISVEVVKKGAAGEGLSLNQVDFPWSRLACCKSFA